MPRAWGFFFPYLDFRPAPPLPDRRWREKASRKRRTPPKTKRGGPRRRR